MQFVGMLGSSDTPQGIKRQKDFLGDKTDKQIIVHPSSLLLTVQKNKYFSSLLWKEYDGVLAFFLNSDSSSLVRQSDLAAIIRMVIFFHDDITE